MAKEKWGSKLGVIFYAFQVSHAPMAVAHL